MRYDDEGREIPDDTPVEVPLRLRRQRPPSIQELIAMHVRAEAQVARAMGEENEEDFEEDDEMDDVLTPYELHAYAAEADQEIRSAELADKLVRRDRERRAGQDVGSAKEKQKEVAGTPGVGKENKGDGKAGSESVGDDRGGEKGA